MLKAFQASSTTELTTLPTVKDMIAISFQSSRSLPSVIPHAAPFHRRYASVKPERLRWGQLALGHRLPVHGAVDVLAMVGLGGSFVAEQVDTVWIREARRRGRGHHDWPAGLVHRVQVRASEEAQGREAKAKLAPGRLWQELL